LEFLHIRSSEFKRSRGVDRDAIVIEVTGRVELERVPETDTKLEADGVALIGYALPPPETSPMGSNLSIGSLPT